MTESADPARWRTEFEKLDWSQGWTQRRLAERFPRIPAEYWRRIPSGQTFYGFADFWNRFWPAGAGTPNAGQSPS